MLLKNFGMQSKLKYLCSIRVGIQVFAYYLFESETHINNKPLSGERTCFSTTHKTPFEHWS